MDASASNLTVNNVTVRSLNRGVNQPNFGGTFSEKSDASIARHVPLRAFEDSLQRVRVNYYANNNDNDNGNHDDDDDDDDNDDDNNNNNNNDNNIVMIISRVRARAGVCFSEFSISMERYLKKCRWGCVCIYVYRF
jgi:hypothetical protein